MQMIPFYFITSEKFMYKRGTIYPVIYKAGLKTSRYFEGY